MFCICVYIGPRIWKIDVQPSSPPNLSFIYLDDSDDPLLKYTHQNTKPALPGDLRWKATELPTWKFSSDEGIEPQQSHAATSNRGIDQMEKLKKKRGQRRKGWPQ